MNISEISNFKKEVTVIGKVLDKSEIKPCRNEGQYMWITLKDVSSEEKIRLTLFNQSVIKVGHLQVFCLLLITYLALY